MSVQEFRPEDDGLHDFQEEQRLDLEKLPQNLTKAFARLYNAIMENRKYVKSARLFKLIYCRILIIDLDYIGMNHDKPMAKLYENIVKVIVANDDPIEMIPGANKVIEASYQLLDLLLEDIKAMHNAVKTGVEPAADSIINSLPQLCTVIKRDARYNLDRMPYNEYYELSRDYSTLSDENFYTFSMDYIMNCTGGMVFVTEKKFPLPISYINWQES